MYEVFLKFLKSVAAWMVGLGMMATAYGQTADAGLYVPTPQSIVDAMLEMGGVKAGDHVLDLGSGDGRIVRTAALRMGASGTGVDIDTRLVAMATRRLRRRAFQPAPSLSARIYGRLTPRVPLWSRCICCHAPCRA